VSDSKLPPSATTHSFVIRLWQETSGTWRGTIRHVQSNARQPFNSLAGAVRFIEQQMKSHREGIWKEWMPTTPGMIGNPLLDRQPALRARAAPSRPRFSGSPHWGRAPTWAAVALLVVLLATVAVLAPREPLAPLSGTAAGESAWAAVLLAFLVGLAVGGSIVGLWIRATINRKHDT